MNIMETIKNVKPKELFKNPKVKRGLAIGGAAVVAIFTTLSDQKKEDDFKDLVNRVNKLENK